ncbi:MAG: ABC transporter permease subunit [Paracoccaceae bacterium]|jgi:glycine betaine/proline transport system permease protein|nr:ABC transporter permease subunit [Paracoccaceae bacterium]HAQ46348.1 ABC transporter permease [Rhodobacter sp.]MDO7660473.1 ABC transporter permease subunit [Paracoccaceae bacterium]MDO7732488.1 ABC transporter permease subunit [Paracoccaceae bacterium]MDP5323654.1 ABC transporter permease subunit [Paracoccaceae bacterium]
MTSQFPQFFDTRAFGRVLDSAFNDVVAAYGLTLELIFLPVLKALLAMEQLLLWLPWWAVLIGFSAFAWLASRSAKIMATVALLIFLIGVIGVWEQAMATVALMLVSTLMAVFLGLPIGVLMSRSNRVQGIALPVLDIMQTMPIFVYLIPFVMLFGPGKIPALLATIVFAIPPVIRLTNLGIRQVDVEIVEASRAFGASPMQVLTTVQAPLALPAILAGINQTTMMALSMVVIASMIGAGGLGYQVLQGIQRLEISRGLFAGLGIVFLAIIFDRIAQAYGKRMQKTLKLGA